MPIKVTCQCGKRFKVDDAYVGRRGRCPACNAELVVPEANAWKPSDKQSSAKRKHRVRDFVVASLVGLSAVTTTLFVMIRMFGESRPAPGLKAATAFIEQVLNETVTDKYGNMSIEFTKVRAIKDDQRKIAWLWTSHTVLNPKGQKSGTSEDVAWDTVFQFNPVTGQGEVLTVTTGNIGSIGTRASNGKSEWKKEFRDKAVRGWELAYVDYLEHRGPMENPITDSSQKDIDAIGDRVAASLGITVYELRCILEDKDQPSAHE
jgi:hypothetical protein